VCSHLGPDNNVGTSSSSAAPAPLLASSPQRERSIAERRTSPAWKGVRGMNRWRPRPARLLLSVGFAALSLAVGSAGASLRTGAANQTLVVDATLAIVTLDPVRSIEPGSAMIQHDIYDTLLTFKNGNIKDIVPSLAQSFSVRNQGTGNVFVF